MMTKISIQTLLALSFTWLWAPAAVSAASNSPVGFWKTVDDETGRQRSVVKVWLDNGKAYGKIVQLYRNPDETDDADPVCDKCQGELKNQKVIGLTILRDLKKDDEEWGDGEILDPGNGEDYSCFIEVQEGGRKLKVRGYLGISLLGRTQYWYRVPKPDLTVRSFVLKPDGTIEPLAYEAGHGPIAEPPAKAAPEPASPAKTPPTPATPTTAEPTP